MKVNHQREFKETRSHEARSYITFSGTATPLDGSAITAVSTCANLEPAGNRKDRAGAKKFLHSRRRRHDRETLLEIKKEHQ